MGSEWTPDSFDLLADTDLERDLPTACWVSPTARAAAAERGWWSTHGPEHPVDDAPVL